MALSSKELQDIAKKLAEELKKGSSLFGGGNDYTENRSSRSSRSSPEDKGASEKLARFGQKFGEEVKNVNDALKVFHRHVRGMNTSSQTYIDAVADLNSIIEDVGGTLDDFERGASQASNNLSKFARNINSNSAASNAFSGQLAKSIANSAAFASALWDNSNSIKDNTELFDDLTKNLKRTSSNLNANILRAANVYDSFTGGLKENLSSADYQKLNLAVANAAATIKNTAERLNIADLSELIGVDLGERLQGDSDLTPALDELAVRLQKSGFDLSDVFDSTKDEVEQYSDLIKFASGIQQQNTHFLKEFAIVAKTAGTELGVLTLKIKNVSSTVQDWADANILSADAIRENASNFASSIGRIFDQLGDFNLAMLPDTFANVQQKAIEMGMSFEETVQYLQANKRLYAMYGPENFEAANDRLMQAYKDQGFTQKQGAAMLANDVALATSGGVNIKDPDKLAGFIEETSKGFKELSSVVNMTHEEYTGALAAINSSTEMTANLVGLDADRAEALRRANAEQYKNYRLMGLSNEQAQEAVLARARENRMGIAAKFETAARETMLASQVGMDPDKIKEMQALSSKSYKTADEQKRLEELRQELGVKAQQAMTEAGESGDQSRHAMLTELYNKTQEGMHEESRNAQNRGLTAEQARRSGIDIDEDEAAAAGEAAEPSQLGMEIADWKNSITAALDNSFVAALFSGTAAVAGLALSAFKASAALRGISGGGSMVGDIMNSVGGRRRRPRGGGAGSARDTQSRWDARREARRNPRAGDAPDGPRGIDRAGNAASREARATARATPSLMERASGRLTPGNMAKAGMRGVGGLVATIGGGMLIDSALENGMISEETATKANAGMDIAGMAATGAMIGSIVPGVGTAIGAGVGGLAGLAMNWDTGGSDLLSDLFSYSPLGMAIDAGSKLGSMFSGEGDATAAPTGSSPTGDAIPSAASSMLSTAASFTPLGLAASAMGSISNTAQSIGSPMDMLAGVTKFGALGLGASALGLMGSDAPSATPAEGGTGGLFGRIFDAGEGGNQAQQALTSQLTSQLASQDAGSASASLNNMVESALDPTGQPQMSLSEWMAGFTPEKLGEAVSLALSGTRLTLYNPATSTTSHAFITGRQTA